MANTKMEDLNLIEKLSTASKLIGSIKKDGNNNRQGYQFQSESAIKAAVKAATEKVGIVIIPTFSVTNQYDRKTAKGTTLHFVDVIGEFVITDGEEHVTGSMPGSGQDTGEKGMAKACTSSQKYFYKQIFNISDREEDPDTTDSNPDGGFVEKSNTSKKQNVIQTLTIQKEKLESEAKSIAKAMNVNVAITLQDLADRAGIKEIAKRWNNGLTLAEVKKMLTEVPKLKKEMEEQPNDQ